MQRFPDLAALAKADEDAVMHSWAGLGYYSRARNLHRAAQWIMKEHHGEFPDTLETVEQLPGIGKSTAGAILSIAFQIKWRRQWICLSRVIAPLFPRYLGIPHDVLS